MTEISDQHPAGSTSPTGLLAPTAVAADPSAFAVDGAARRGRAGFGRAFWASPSGKVGAVVLLILVVLSVIGTVIAPYDANVAAGPALQPPSGLYWLGTDENGRDLLSRVIVGTRASLVTAVGASAIAAIIGVPLGVLAGYLGAWVDACTMRLTDFVLALPGILFALVVVAVLGGSTMHLTLAIGVGAFPAFARLARASTLSLRERPYVLAARTMGASKLDIMVRSIVPNIMPPLVVQAVITASVAVLAAAGLSFLGLGAPPPDPTWGAMLQSSRSYLYQAPLYGISPGLALVITIAAFDAIGRGTREALGAQVNRAQASAVM